MTACRFTRALGTAIGERAVVTRDSAEPELGIDDRHAAEGDPALAGDVP